MGLIENSYNIFLGVLILSGILLTFFIILHTIDLPEEPIIIEDILNFDKVIEKIHKTLKGIQTTEYFFNEGSDTIIKYRIQNPETCGDLEIKKINKAVKRIEKDTDNHLIFQEVEDNEEILFECLLENNITRENNRDYYTLGTSEGTLIDHQFSKINIYKYQYQMLNLYEGVEVHEILHSLGFEHNYIIENSIMNPISKNTNFIIDEKIIEDIKLNYL